MGGMGEGREVQEGGDICVHTADSLCCRGEISTKGLSYESPELNNELLKGPKERQHS